VSPVLRREARLAPAPYLAVWSRSVVERRWAGGHGGIGAPWLTAGAARRGKGIGRRWNYSAGPFDWAAMRS
jgi:hypothetical protein